MWQQVSEEVVLVDLSRGEYYGLNDVGSRMWIALEESRDVGIAYERLCGTYEVDQETLRGDLAAFVDRLVGLGLLTTP
jgi:hypothetical protein